MREPAVLKIGDFARVGQVSIATLRYYDQWGLLKPTELDSDTGYRYYALDQLPRLNRTLSAQRSGLSPGTDCPTAGRTNSPLNNYRGCSN